jgi:succinate dehydrogenase hydrophobic anchor subunit
MYILHNGPYRARAQQKPWLRQILTGYALVLKVILILCVTTVFFQGTIFLLGLSSADWVQILVLALWACGLVPLLYTLWQLDLKPRQRQEMPANNQLRRVI